MTSLTVSVVIPTFNCAHLLPLAIRSAYEQTVPPSEVVVVDDGSTDDTPHVLDRLAADLPASFKHIRKPNGGEASARNAGVALASGELIAFLDQDDTWVPTKIERQLAEFEADPSRIAVFTAYAKVSESISERIGVDEWHEQPDYAIRQLMRRCCITPSTVMVRRQQLLAAGPFDESLWLGNDWEMWVRLAVRGSRMAYLDEALTSYRWHDSNMSKDERKIPAAALVIFGRLFDSGELSPSLQRLERPCLARWHMIAAHMALSAGDLADARRSITRAARTHPLSIRPGWVLIYARSVLGR